MLIKKFGFPLVFKKVSEVDNKNYLNRYEELRNMCFYCCDLWDNIAYAWLKIQSREGSHDPRFYYQSIIFNLYILSSITKSIEFDVLSKAKGLKDLRDNIAHIDEKLKNPLNFVPLNDIRAGSVIDRDGIKTFTTSLTGLRINPTNNTTASPLGIVGDTIFSTLQPSEKSQYDKFASFELTEMALTEIQTNLFTLLKKYFTRIELDD